MCHPSGMVFGRENLSGHEIAGKRVLEVGASDVNGSLRAYVESLGPIEYVGTDIAAGKGVDVICRVEGLIERFGHDSFDVVISTETLEHVRDWRAAVTNIKGVCRKGGIVLLSTRSHGFPYHGYPHDYWRFEIADIAKIFSDFTVVTVTGDPSYPGVFAKAVKPENYVEQDLSSFPLYSIVTDTKVAAISTLAFVSGRYFVIMFGVARGWVASRLVTAMRAFGWQGRRR